MLQMHYFLNYLLNLICSCEYHRALGYPLPMSACVLRFTLLYTSVYGPCLILYSAKGRHLYKTVKAAEMWRNFRACRFGSIVANATIFTEQSFLVEIQNNICFFFWKDRGGRIWRCILHNILIYRLLFDAISRPVFWAK
jgi:hypothetical protein